MQPALVKVKVSIQLPMAILRTEEAAVSGKGAFFMRITTKLQASSAEPLERRP